MTELKDTIAKQRKEIVKKYLKQMRVVSDQRDRIFNLESELAGMVNKLCDAKDTIQYLNKTRKYNRIISFCINTLLGCALVWIGSQL